MSSKWPQPGVGMVAEYQKSGIPYVTSSNGSEVGATTPVQISFPRVTRWFEIRPFSNSSANYLKVGFTSNGVKSIGAVTASIPTGEMDESTGTDVHVTVQPAPNAYEQSAAARNWFTVPVAATSPAVRYELGVTDIFLLTDSSTCGFSIVAGLTNIHRGRLELTGSNGFYGVG